MNKKNIYIACALPILIAISLNAFASSNKSPFDGFYAGINAGAAFTKGEFSTTSSVTFINQFDENNQLASSQKADIANHNGGGSIYAGYGQALACSNFYLAGEIFANTFKREATLNNYVFHTQPNDDEDYESLTLQTKAKLKDGEFGFDLKPGILLGCNTMLYGRVGVAFNKLSLDTNRDFSFTSQVSETVVIDSPLSQSTTKNVSSLRLGVGLESYICKNLALTADYIYTDYNSAKLAGQADVITAIETGEGPLFFVVPNGLVDQTSADLTTQTVTVGIKYYFG